MKRLILAVIMFSFVGSIPAIAVETTATPKVTKRQHRQVKRIRQGVKSGELTKDEAEKLMQEERSIRQMKKEIKADGVVTNDERKDLHKALNDQSRDIYEEKHDAEKK